MNSVFYLETWKNYEDEILFYLYSTETSEILL